MREIAAIVAIEITAKHRLRMGDERNRIVAQEGGANIHPEIYSIYIYMYVWYDSLNGAGWRAPVQIAFVNCGDGSITVRFQGRTLDRRRQEARVQVPYLIYTLLVIDPKHCHWSVAREEAESLTASSVTVGAVFQQFWLALISKAKYV